MVPRMTAYRSLLSISRRKPDAPQKRARPAGFDLFYSVQYLSRNPFLKILPEPVLGISATKSTDLGAL